MERAQDIHSTSQPLVSKQIPRVDCIKGRVNLQNLHANHPLRYPYLLESSAQSDTTRYSILFAYPAESLQLNANGQLVFNNKTVSDSNDFLGYLDHKWQQYQQQYQSDVTLPFSGGWFLFLGYELAQQIEPRLNLPMPEDGFPVACAVRIPAAIIYDHATDETYIVVEGDKRELLDNIKRDIKKTDNTETIANNDLELKINLSEEEPERYIHNVAKVKRYIIDGDVFQVNLSRRWSSDRPTDLTPYQVYQQLLQSNPAPFSGIMQFPFGSIISSSPERLLSIRNGIASTRPIAGTRPRSKDIVDDKAFKDELIAHPKERAEHIMLIDLERNDLGRVCKPGSIEVDELMVLESYAHVHHIVSNVKGMLRTGVKPGEAIRAVFPGGTITGCPKERCMAIIAELEKEARGAYTGSVGYLNHNGDMDLNILIRTITMTGNEIRFRAGAGLVFDSIAEKELEETRHKAKGMLLALGCTDA